MCGTCAGIGISGEKCPECGKSRYHSTAEKRQDISKIVEEAKVCRIPHEYLGVNWSPDVFWVAYGSLKGDRLKSHFVTQLDSIHAVFSSGRLPTRSALFFAPSHHSKVTWAYSCMQHALKARYSCAPVLDTLEIKRLLVLAGESPNKQVSGVDYETYIESDVCFFTVTKTEYRRGAFTVIMELLDKRSRRGLTTFGLSRYTLAELASWDRSGEFKKFSGQWPAVNPLKVPTIISCL